MKGKHQRLILVSVAIVALIGAVLLAMSALKDQAAYFYTPSEARAKAVAPGTAFRLGGMVVKGSVKRASDGINIRFEVSDGKGSLPVAYAGVTPDLFREGSGVVADGALRPDGTFEATEILAKHDENYMPRELEGMKYDEETHKIEQKPQ
ncbi:cytochrome c maturation protein CcmE [Sphingobium sufflavum]|uniref:cytochrome c maturation protein CcmE n=1 Tax=Sphingobium sufflavum TaxID=1129547 RepID=UPI001F1C3484|nr:cytochrome c maturation protein CcmE [Sphingobium sufflavum]MCE7797404.1 cytochrome c maturation protein CcmE [Sphingobium sufflavum]